MIKNLYPDTRVFSYHNVLLALGCFESQNSAMYNPADAGLFLQVRQSLSVMRTIAQIAGH